MADQTDYPVFATAPYTSQDVSSLGQALFHHAVGSVVPTAGSILGAEPGAYVGASLGALGGPFDPLTIPAGALIGGGIGAFLGGSAASAGQEQVFRALPGMARALGQDDETRAVEEQEHPYASLAGGFIPQAVAMPVTFGGENNLLSRGLGALIQGGQQAGQEYWQTGEIDPAKVAIAGAAGAFLNGRRMGYVGPDIGAGLRGFTRAGMETVGVPVDLLNRADQAFGRRPPDLMPPPGSNYEGEQPPLDLRQPPSTSGLPIFDRSGAPAAPMPPPGSNYVGEQPNLPMPPPAQMSGLPLFDATPYQPPPRAQPTASPLATAVWRSKDYDYPVELTGETHAGPDGRVYTKVNFNGSQTFVPADELIFPQGTTPAAGSPDLTQVPPGPPDLTQVPPGYQAQPGAPTPQLPEAQARAATPVQWPGEPSPQGTIEQMTERNRPVTSQDLTQVPPGPSPAAATLTPQLPEARARAAAPVDTHLEEPSPQGTIEDMQARQQAQIGAERGDILNDVLASHEPGRGTPYQAFADALENEGHDARIRPDEAERISRFEEARDAFAPEPPQEDTTLGVPERAPAPEPQAEPQAAPVSAEAQTEADAAVQAQDRDAQYGAQLSRLRDLQRDRMASAGDILRVNKLIDDKASPVDVKKAVDEVALKAQEKEAKQARAKGMSPDRPTRDTVLAKLGNLQKNKLIDAETGARLTDQALNDEATPYEISRAADRAADEAGAAPEPANDYDAVRTRVNNLVEGGRLPQDLAQRWLDVITDRSEDPDVLNKQLDDYEKRQGKFKQAVDRRTFLKGSAAATAAAPGEALARTPLPEKGIQAIVGKAGAKANQMASWLANTTKNPLFQKIAAKLARGGFGETTVHIADVDNPRDPLRGGLMEAGVQSARGVTEFNNEGSNARITLAKTADPNKTGLTEETLLHELIHAWVGARYRDLNTYLPENLKRTAAPTVSKAYPEISKVRDVLEQAKDAIVKNRDALSDKNGDLPLWAQVMHDEPDERLSWALTNKDAQDFLKTHDEYGEKIPEDGSLWQKIVNWFRQLFGLQPKDGSLFGKVLDASHALFDTGSLYDKPDFAVSKAETARFPTEPGANFKHALGAFSGGGTPEQKAQRAQDISNAVQEMGGKFRRAAYSLMDQDWVAQIHKVDAPELESIRDVQALASSESQARQSDAAKIIERWTRRLNPEETAAVGKLLQDATVEQHDVFTDKGPITDRFNRLSQQAQNVYKDIQHYHQQEADDFLQFGKDLLARDPTISDEERKAGEDDLDRRFKRLKVYSPLMRFGDYYVDARSQTHLKAEADLERETARLNALQDAGANDETMTAARQSRDAAFKAHEQSIENQQRVNRAFENERDMKAYAQELQKQGWKVQQGKVIERQFNPGGHASVFLNMAQRSLERIAQNGDANTRKYAEGMQTMLKQLYFQTMPETSRLRSGFARSETPIPGFDENAVRAFALSSKQNAGYLAQLKIGYKVHDYIAQMEDRARTLPDNTRLVDAINEQNKRLAALQTYASMPALDFLRNMTHMWMLGLSPSAMVMHVMQTPMFTAPMLAARFKVGDVARELSAAAAHVGSRPKTFTTQEGALATEFGRTAQEKQGLAYIQRRGVISNTETHMLTDAAASDNKVIHLGNKAMQIAGTLMHHTERFNRATTFLGAMKLAMDNPERTPQLSAERMQEIWKNDPQAPRDPKLLSAIEYAKQITLDSHVDYTRENRPPLLNSVLGRLAFQFQNYQLGMLKVLGTNLATTFSKSASKEERWVAAKTLSGILATHGVMTGAMGLPGAGLLAFALNMHHKILGDQDVAFDAQDSMRQWANQHMGQMGDAFMRGILYLPGLKDVAPADITDRLGLGDMIASGDRVGQVNREDFLSYVGQTLGGPAAGLLGNMADAWELSHQGDYWKAAELAMPKTLRDIMRVYRYQNEGVTTKAGNQVVSPDQFNFGNMAVQMMGFEPQLVQSDYANRAAVMGAKTELDNRRTALIHEYVEGMIRGDDDKAQAAQDEIGRFNALRYQEGAYPEAIKGAELGRALMDRRMNAIRLNQGVSLPPKQRALAQVYGVENPTQ